jgi:hypothetical protein
MIESTWWADPSVLWRHWKHFFPNPNAPISNAYNAIVRFAVYGGILLFMVTRNAAYVTAIPFVMIGTFVMYQLAPPTEHMTTMKDAFKHISCMKPTKDNPMMNVKMHEYTDAPDRPPACNISKKDVATAANQYLMPDFDLGEEANRKALARQFVTMPNSRVGSDQAAALKFMYGAMPQGKIVQSF